MRQCGPVDWASCEAATAPVPDWPELGPLSCDSVSARPALSHELIEVGIRGNHETPLHHVTAVAVFVPSDKLELGNCNCGEVPLEQAPVLASRMSLISSKL